jgi:hypothetical protein
MGDHHFDLAELSLVQIRVRPIDPAISQKAAESAAFLWSSKRNEDGWVIGQSG